MTVNGQEQVALGGVGRRGKHKGRPPTVLQGRLGHRDAVVCLQVSVKPRLRGVQHTHVYGTLYVCVSVLCGAHCIDVVWLCERMNVTCSYHVHTGDVSMQSVRTL